MAPISPDLFAAIFAAATDSMVVADSEMRLVAVNPAACQLFGFPEEELLGHRISEFSVPEDEPADTFSAFIDTGAMSGEYRIVRPTGEIRLAHFNAVSNVLPGLHLSILQDLGPLPAPRTVHEASERARLALQAGEMGTWEWELPSRRIIWSPELERVHGLSPGQFDGTFEMSRALVHPLDVDALTSASESFLLVGKLSTEYRIIRPDGEIRWLSVQGKLYRSGSPNAPSFAVGVSLDITEQRRQQEALALIVEASRALASSLDYEATLSSVAELAVPDLADWCSVYVLND